jgi:hypothetical protein
VYNTPAELRRLLGAFSEAEHAPDGQDVKLLLDAALVEKVTRAQVKVRS